MRVRRNFPARSGIVTLELILVLPILVIFIAMVVEFAELMMVNESVAQASRLGARIASRESRAGLATLNTGDLRSQIDAHLTQAGLNTGACRIILEHNLPEYDTTNNGIRDTTRIDDSPSAGECDCEPQALPIPTTAPPSIFVESVRVTVCVPAGGNVPNLLDYVGFDLDNYTISSSTVFQFEQ